MRPIRVLVVDDSALMRQMIGRILTEAGMEVVGTARDGIEALEKAALLQPDVMTLDVEMPRMDGLTALRLLMAERPMPVVMLSSLTQEQAPTAVEALSIGAVDVVGKPGGTISLNLMDVADEIVRKVRAAASAKVFPTRKREQGTGLGRWQSRPAGTFETGGAKPSGPPAGARGMESSWTIFNRSVVDAVHPGESKETQASDVAGGQRARDDNSRETGRRARGWRPGSHEPPLVVVGSSTGGPKALTQLFSALPKEFPAPVVVVQHMPIGFTRALALRLNDVSPLEIAEAAPGRVPRAGEVWIAKAGVHLVFNSERVMCEDLGPPHMGVRPAVDITLESAVDRWGGNVVAVILTGMGMDGARGCRKVKQAGGKVLAQDEQSSVIYGMPRAVVEMGLADRVEDIEAMAGALVHTVYEAMGVEPTM